MQGFKLKVLVADDSALMHSLFADFALGSSIPFELVRANNGLQCAELFNIGGFNLAFIDVNMPEMSGMEAVATARNSGNKTFVTLMSGKARGALRSRASSRSMNTCTNRSRRKTSRRS